MPIACETTVGPELPTVGALARACCLHSRCLLQTLPTGSLEEFSDASWTA